MASAPAMAEAELQTAVTDLCKLFGLHWHHQQISIHSKRGWPDLVIAGRRLIFRELKRQDKNPTPSQLEWGAILARAGGDWSVWRPSDLRSGRIQRELESIR